MEIRFLVSDVHTKQLEEEEEKKEGWPFIGQRKRIQNQESEESDGKEKFPRNNSSLLSVGVN